MSQMLHYLFLNTINTLVLSIYVDVVLTPSIIDNVKLPLSLTTTYILISFAETQGLQSDKIDKDTFYAEIQSFISLQ